MEGKLNSFQDKIYKIQREEEFLKKHSMALQQNKNIPDIIKSPTASISMEDIDAIHENMSERMVNGIPGLDQDLKKWVKANQLPVDLKFLLNLAISDKEKNDALSGDLLEREELCTGEAIQ